MAISSSTMYSHLHVVSPLFLIVVWILYYSDLCWTVAHVCIIRNKNAIEKDRIEEVTPKVKVRFEVKLRAVWGLSWGVLIGIELITNFAYRSRMFVAPTRERNYAARPKKEDSRRRGVSGGSSSATQPLLTLVALVLLGSECHEESAAGWPQRYSNSAMACAHCANILSHWTPIRAIRPRRNRKGPIREAYALEKAAVQKKWRGSRDSFRKRGPNRNMSMLYACGPRRICTLRFFVKLSMQTEKVFSLTVATLAMRANKRAARLQDEVKLRY